MTINIIIFIYLQQYVFFKAVIFYFLIKKNRRMKTSIRIFSIQFLNTQYKDKNDTKIRL